MIITRMISSKVGRMRAVAPPFRNSWLHRSSPLHRHNLNKKDIFDEKIRYFDLRVNFPAFTGRSCDSAEAKDFILDMFLTPVKNLRSVKC